MTEPARLVWELYDMAYAHGLSEGLEPHSDPERTWANRAERFEQRAIAARDALLALLEAK